ncbi:hypothetical protein AGMMS50212_17000 [Spirochaetia bacterium]|nr:hypothetical protein AGMMS50212_17000 [Spirochaetia bacterium]
MNKKVLKKIQNFDLIISGTALSALILYTFLGVVMRYFVNRPITWGEEFQLFCEVITIFFGAGAGFRLGSHVAIDIVVDLFPKRAQRIIEIFIWAVSIVILVYFTVQSASFVRQMYATKRTTDILDIPHFITYSAVPLSAPEVPGAT